MICGPEAEGDGLFFVCFLLDLLGLFGHSTALVPGLLGSVSVQERNSGEAVTGS